MKEANSCSLRRCIAEFLFAVEGAAQGGIGANWGDGFATDPALIRATGISDPNPFFKQLMRKSYRRDICSARSFVFFAPCLRTAIAVIHGPDITDRAVSRVVSVQGQCPHLAAHLPDEHHRCDVGQAAAAQDGLQDHAAGRCRHVAGHGCMMSCRRAQARATRSCSWAPATTLGLRTPSAT